jgi:hypothetical protein
MPYSHVPPQPNIDRSAVRSSSHPRLSIISLGKIIVALYVTTLLAAVISAHVIDDNGEGKPAERSRVLIESIPTNADG